MNKPTALQEYTRYVSLNVAAMLGLSLYILADTFFVAQGVGSDGLAALNLAVPLYNIMHGTGLMLGMGGATKFTLLASQGKHRDANRMFTTAVQATVCSAVFFFLLGALGAPGLTRLLGGEGHVGQLTCTYLRVLLMFSPVFLFNDLMLCFVRNDGAPRRAMAATLTGCLMNIVLDYVFIFPLGMGMFGAVLATGCSPILGLIIQSGHWLGGKASFQLQKTTPRPAELGSIGALGFPSFLSEACSGVVMILFNTILLQVEGSIGVAAYGVVANLALVVTAMFTGIAQGTQPLLSQACGQRDAARVGFFLRCAIATALVLSALVVACTLLFADPIALAFNSEGSARLQALACQGLHLYFLSAPFVGLCILLCLFFTATDRPRPSHIIALLRGFFLVVPVTLVLARLFGLTGVWLAVPAAEALTALIGLMLYLRQPKPRALPPR